MKCEKCGKGKFRYNQRNPNKDRLSGTGKELFVRTDFSAKCPDCGYSVNHKKESLGVEP